VCKTPDPHPSAPSAGTIYLKSACPCNSLDDGRSEIPRSVVIVNNTWGIAGMLHDFDDEMHPRAPHHPMKGGEILSARGVPPAVIYAVLAHADYSGMPRVSVLDRALYACDELSGFIHACALVRPGRVISGLEPSSVKKKLKDKAFARTVNRDNVYRGAAELGVELDEHIAFVVRALTGVAPDIGLAVG
jgi:predicted hydrolase (HD superfamily)